MLRLLFLIFFYLLKYCSSNFFKWVLTFIFLFLTLTEKVLFLSYLEFTILSFFWIFKTFILRIEFELLLLLDIVDLFLERDFTFLFWEGIFFVLNLLFFSGIFYTRISFNYARGLIVTFLFDYELFGLITSLLSHIIFFNSKFSSFKELIYFKIWLQKGS